MNKFAFLEYYREIGLDIRKVTSKYINIRCPICGDSRHTKIKARGYFIIKGDTVSYYCHNCPDPSRSVKGFLLHPKVNRDDVYQKMLKTQRNIKFKLETKEIKNVKVTIKKTEKKIVHNADKKIIEDMVSVRYNTDTVYGEYLSKRNIPKERWDELFTCEINPYLHFSRLFKSEKYIDKFGSRNIDRKIVKIMYDRNNIPYGLIYRSLDNTNKDFRFLILSDRGDESNDFLGIEKVDFNEPVYIVEGLFDKLSFADDSQVLAMISLNTKIDLLKQYEADFSRVTFIFDNEYDNESVDRRIKQVIDIGAGVVIWENNFTGKDVNDLKNLTNFDDGAMMKYFDNCTYRGLKAKLKLTDKINKFTNKNRY